MQPKYPLPDPKNAKTFSILERAVSVYKVNDSVLIGITGAGGAGKTTFAENIVAYYGHDQALAIDLDDYLLSREERGKIGVTGYDPKANNLYLARDQLEDLLAGKVIQKPRYDHGSGKLLPFEMVEPRELMIVEGVTTLYPELRELFPVSFFLDALEETQIQSRIERDVKQRGYSLKQALELFNAIKPDYARFIEPTKKHASVITQVDIDYVMHPTLIKEELR